MEGDLLCLLSPLWGLAANVLTQILCARRPGASLLKSIFVGFFVGATVCAASDVLLAARGPATSLPLIQVLPFNLLLFGMLGYCYFHTINMAVTARRIRILRGIYLAAVPPRLEDILSEYSAGDMVRKRIERLLGSGQVRLVDGRYHIQPGALLGMTLALRLLKRCVYGKHHG